MEKKIKRQLEWNLDESGNHPQHTGWFLVQGKIIVEGKIRTETRIVYYEKGNKFSCVDMQVIMWSELPETIC